MRLLLAFALQAAGPAQPLTLEEVLAASARAAPQIVEALARTQAAEGRRLTADGAFDTVFDVDAASRVAGFYDGTVVEGRATRPFDTNGGNLYGGYRVSRGTFPIYEDRAYTNRLGELKVGTLYSLLRDRVIDERRTRRVLAEGDVAVARFEAQAVAIGVQRRAIDAYQSWVAAGLRLNAYRDLQALADARRGGIARQVELGARPNVALVEIDQNVSRRRALVARAEQDLAVAGNALSFFVRDANGERVAIGPERLPSTLPTLAGVDRTRATGVARPDAQAVLARVEQAAARLALAENELRPRLDLRGEVARDFGAIGRGGPSRNGTEAIVGVRFAVPLQNRAARGRVREARAEIDAMNARRRIVDDQIAVEVEGVVLTLSGAERVAALVAQERQLAERMATAERRRLQLGAGDLFLVNAREETAADALVRQIDAEARVVGAQADIASATADLRALGIANGPLPTRP